jgi:GTPase SAR1 family protein
LNRNIHKLRSELIISFYGAPGCGKSTIALGFTSYLKSQGVNAEYVGEYIKNLIAEHGENHTPIYNQLDILVNQNKLLRSFHDKCDYVITDGGLLNTIVYMDTNKDKQLQQCKDSITDLCWSLYSFSEEKSFNILVDPCEREELYKDSLRNFSFQQSLDLHARFMELICYDFFIHNYYHKGVDYKKLHDELCKYELIG